MEAFLKVRVRELELLLHILWQPQFDEVGDVLAVLAVAVRHAEEVPVVVVAHVRMQDEAVLVYFVWVVRNEADSGRKCVLRDYVALYVLRAAKSRGRRGRALVLQLRSFNSGVRQVENFLRSHRLLGSHLAYKVVDCLDRETGLPLSEHSLVVHVLLL